MTQNDDWYNRVYLCLSNDVTKGFQCYRYGTMHAADRSHLTAKTSTMIPVCKWVPPIFDKYILNWKLKKLYWSGNIRIYHGYSQRNKK